MQCVHNIQQCESRFLCFTSSLSQRQLRQDWGWVLWGKALLGGKGALDGGSVELKPVSGQRANQRERERECSASIGRWGLGPAGCLWSWPDFRSVNKRDTLTHTHTHTLIHKHHSTMSHPKGTGARLWHLPLYSPLLLLLVLSVRRSLQSARFTDPVPLAGKWSVKVLVSVSTSRGHQIFKAIVECINKTWSVTKKKRANYEGSNRRNKGRKGWVAIIWVSSDSIFFSFLPLSFSLSLVF